MVDQEHEKDKGNSTSHGDILGEEAVKSSDYPERPSYSFHDRKP
ncbi:MAG: hypothetical protein ACI4CS_10490 [Candidatus Weimeria sp.]